MAAAPRNGGVGGRLHDAHQARDRHPDRRAPQPSLHRKGHREPAIFVGWRFELGLGVGWDAHEYEVAGVPLRQRGGRTDEILQIFERLWTGEPVTHHGRYYHFEDVFSAPPLPRKPFVWLAGGSNIKTDLSPDPEVMAPTVLE